MDRATSIKLATLSCVWLLLLSTKCVAVTVIEDPKLQVSEIPRNGFLGSSVASNGKKTIVGATFSGSSAYVFDSATGQRLSDLVPVGGERSIEFGRSIAIEGNTALIGAPGDWIGNNRTGGVYLFDLSTGAQIKRVHPSNGKEGDYFGTSLAVNNGVAVVGAFGDDDYGQSAGAAYLLHVATGAMKELHSPDPSADQFFGGSVAIDNGKAVISASGATVDQDGAVYVFDAETGQHLIKLTDGSPGSRRLFGGSVAISDGVIAVGAPYDRIEGAYSGSVFLFDANTGLPLHKLVPEVAILDQFFGRRVEIDNGVVAVTAPGHQNSAGTGSVYLFDVDTGKQLANVVSNENRGGDMFGSAIDLYNGQLFIGAPFRDIRLAATGAAYSFRIVPEPQSAVLGVLGTLLCYACSQRRGAFPFSCSR